MKKGQIYQGTVQSIRFPNRGIVITDEGEKVIVPNALPGQKITFRLRKNKAGQAEGILQEILSESPMVRTDDICPHSGICGGCLFASLPYEEQLFIKEKEVRELLDHTKIPYIWDGIKESPAACSYRNKMEYTFGNERIDGELTLGLHRRNAYYDIIPVPKCVIADPDFGMIITKTQEFFRKEDVPYYHKITHQGILRNLLVRRGIRTDELMIGLVTTSALSEDIVNRFADFIEGLPFRNKLVSFLHIVNDDPADCVKADSIRILYGQDFITEKLFNLTFKITPFSFFQTNTKGAEVLYSVVRSYLGDGAKKTVFDLYSGTGTITEVVAPFAKKVIGIEIVPEAVRAARENAEKNGLTNCIFYEGDVLHVLDTISEHPDVILLDPPRDGVHAKALEKIIAYNAEQIIYISCKPTSLARDLPVLYEGGYTPLHITSVDMFPGTVNVEMVALLQKTRIRTK